MRIRSLENRIALIFFLLIFTVQFIGFFVIKIAIDNNARISVRNELMVGERIFQRILEQHAQKLTQGARLLATDYGFLQAITSNDLETITSALSNHGDRIGSIMTILIEPNHVFKASTLPRGPHQGLKESIVPLVSKAENQGTAAGIGIINNHPYQIVVVPVKAPVIIGWIAMTFPIDQSLANDMRAISSLHVWIFTKGISRPWTLEAATLPYPHHDSSAMLQGISTGPAFLPELKVEDNTYSRRSLPLVHHAEQTTTVILLNSISEAIAPYRHLQITLLGLTALGIGITVAGSFITAKRITDPLRQLTENAKRLGSGDYKGKIEIKTGDELEDLAEQFNCMTVQLEESYTHLENKVIERTAKLSEAQNIAEEATRAKSMFLANMSHEIRTPMNAIIGLSHLALKTELSDKQQDYLIKIHRAGTSLLGIINDILDFSKIEAGKLDIESTPFTLQNVIDNVLTIVGDNALKKGLKLSSTLATGLPASLVGDPLRLGQILTNLVNNAVKFTAKGEINIHVDASENVSDFEMITLKFSVHDTGMGMSPEQQTHLFQAFNQADNSTTRKYGGTGLGLTISKRLVELMQGEIWVESQPDRGSTFSFTARFGTGTGTTVMEDNADSAKAGYDPASLQGLRILLADDSSINQQIAVELMSELGIMVETADNGRIVIEKLGNNPAYDIVLMDLQMPEMDGYSATQVIRSNPAFTALPIIAMTAHAMAEERQRCLDIGMNDHISKPIDPETLFSTLARWDQRTSDTTASMPSPNSNDEKALSSSSHSAEWNDDSTADIPSPALHPTQQEFSSTETLIIMDQENALRRLGGNRNLYRKLLVQLTMELATAPVRIETLLSTHTKTDRETAERLAHTLKGDAANLGVMTLKDVASQLEKAIHTAQENADLLSEFTNVSISTIATIRATFPEKDIAFRGTEKSALAAQQTVLQISNLQQLARYLESNSDQSLDYFVQHHSDIFAILGEHADAVERSINEYDLKKALAKLREGAQQLNIKL